MKSDFPHPVPNAAARRAVLSGPDWPQVSILAALLDASWLYGEPGLAAGTLQPLFAEWWPEISLTGALAELCAAGLVRGEPDGSYAVPEPLRAALTADLAHMLASQPVDLPLHTVEFGSLLDDFARYLAAECQGTADPAAQEAWAGKAFVTAGRRSYLLLRPMPLFLRAQAEAHTLLLCTLPVDGGAAISGEFVRMPALRHRLALFDLEQGCKINLTRGELAVFFERYLQRVQRLRLATAATFTRCLVEAGLLSFEKG